MLASAEPIVCECRGYKNLRFHSSQYKYLRVCFREKSREKCQREGEKGGGGGREREGGGREGRDGRERERWKVKTDGQSDTDRQTHTGTERMTALLGYRHETERRDGEGNDRFL